MPVPWRPGVGADQLPFWLQHSQEKGHLAPRLSGARTMTRKPPKRLPEDQGLRDTDRNVIS